MGSSDSNSRMGFNAAWSMAVGGMIGGGIFSTLGVVIAISGQHAWFSFLVAGLVALLAGYSYVQLAAHYGEGGGAFNYLRRQNAAGLAGALSWVLIAGYLLTNSVYAFTFGQYLGEVTHLGPWLPRVAAVGIIATFAALNLRGVGQAGFVEIVLVWFKVAVLAGLAAFGLAQWQPAQLEHTDHHATWTAAVFGAAAVFMAYEGFQLLAYDYDDIRKPRHLLPRVILTAVPVVILVYILVALGTAMLIGADAIVEHKEVALAIAGREAFGLTGLVIVTLAAAASTGSAINSTLFATARLTHTVADAGELPAALAHRNRSHVPDRAIVALGVASAVPAAIGNLEPLVEGASLAFLLTFAVVCGLAWQQRAGARLLTGLGTAGASLSALALLAQLVRQRSPSLLAFGALLAAGTCLRPWLKRHWQTGS